jgi:hypothetical protein
MDHQATIEDTLRRAQGMLWNSLPPPAMTPDDVSVKKLRALVKPPKVDKALACSGDTVAAFSLRAMRRVLADHACDECETVTRLWPILDDPMLHAVIGVDLNSRVRIFPTIGATGLSKKHGL